MPRAGMAVPPGLLREGGWCWRAPAAAPASGLCGGRDPRREAARAWGFELCERLWQGAVYDYTTLPGPAPPRSASHYGRHLAAADTQLVQQCIWVPATSRCALGNEFSYRTLAAGERCWSAVVLVVLVVVVYEPQISH